MRSPLRTLGLVLNIERAESRNVGRSILESAGEHGVRVLIESRSAHFLRRRGMPLERVISQADGIVAAGGDGTLLSTVAHAAEKQCPILGINVGSLGFLTSIAADQSAEAVAGFIRNDWPADERTMLSVAIRHANGRLRQVGVALNDAHFARRLSRSLLVHLYVWVDEVLLTSYAADGFLVATPTGSTAYSLAAHGAVVTPTAPVLSLTPICPHTLTNRPMIISDKSVIRMQSARRERLWISLDGHRGAAVPPDASVEVRLAERRITLAAIGSPPFFEVLRNKLRWSGSNV
jgi:NAD+ kinase